MEGAGALVGWERNRVGGLGVAVGAGPQLSFDQIL